MPRKGGSGSRPVKQMGRGKVATVPAGSAEFQPGGHNLGMSFNPQVPGEIPHQPGGKDPILQFIKAGRNKLTR